MGPRVRFLYFTAVMVWVIAGLVSAVISFENWVRRGSTGSVPFDVPRGFAPFLDGPVYCDRRGWAVEGNACTALGMNPIPRPIAETCPGSYEIWRYSLRRPAICVRRA